MRSKPLGVLIGLALSSWALMAEAPPEELPPLAKVGEQGILATEFLFAIEEAPTPSCHASTIVETSSGLVAAWFGGTREGAPDVSIWVSRQIGSSWSKPEEVANGVQAAEVRHPCWNPVLYQPKEGPLMLFSKVGPTVAKWWGVLQTSTDGGRSWTKPRKLGEDPKIGHLIGPVKNKPILLPDGRLLCPSSTEHDGWRVHFEITPDLGKTWQVVGPIHDGKEFAAIQPAVLSHPGGGLQVLCRSRQNVITQAWSTDQGQSWGPMTAISLPNPNSGIDAITLRDGRHLLVYNHSTRAGRNRGLLNVALSSDGKKWKTILTLEDDKGEFSYPAVIQAADGRVHITYTYKRKTIKHVQLDPKAL